MALDNQDPATVPLLRAADQHLQPLQHQHQTSGLPIVVAGGPAYNRNAHAQVATSPQQQQPLSALQRFAISTFATLRIIRGLAFIIYPALSADSFDLPEDGGSSGAASVFILGSLLGVRDLLLGGLLYTADERLEREVRRALVVNLLSDAMDTFILIFSAACSARWEHHVASIVCVALLALLEHLTLFTMNDDDELELLHAARRNNGYDYGGMQGGNYHTMLQANEDKKMRLETWLTELRYAEDEVESVSVSQGAGVENGNGNVVDRQQQFV